VVHGLGDLVDMVLDAGPARVGIESTVLALAPRPRLLRPGMVTREQIEDVIGLVESPPEYSEGPHASPGLHPRHYSPRTPLFLVEHGDLPRHGRGAYLWIAQPMEAALAREMPADPDAYGALLYATLHELDGGAFDWIAVEMPPTWPDWEAICDRLRRAAGRP
jgi:L-threonylcarbamoyladenylate synthase